MKIKELVLETVNLSPQKEFYTQQLGFSLVSESEDEFTLQAGSSLLKFRQVDQATPYHFAFNISSNKIKEALGWLQQYIEVLSFQGEFIQDFIDWNAQAIYFYDLDNNIVEFIARKNTSLKVESTNFDLSHIECISEIGVPTIAIESIYHTLQTNLGLSIYDGSLERFCAIGTETGLFICIDRFQKKWFPVDDVAYPSNFKLKGRVEGKSFSIKYEGESLFVW